MSDPIYFAGGIFDGWEGALQGAKYGAIGGAIGGSVGAFYSGQNWGLERVTANSLAGGITSAAQGGSFADGFKYSSITSSAAWAYTSTTKYLADPRPGDGLPGPDGTYRPNSDGTVPNPRKLVIGLNDRPLVFGADGTPEFWTNINKQGGFPGTILNYIPGLNAIGILHDTWWNPVNIGIWLQWLYQLGNHVACGGSDVWRVTQ